MPKDYAKRAGKSSAKSKQRKNKKTTNINAKKQAKPINQQNEGTKQNHWLVFSAVALVMIGISASVGGWWYYSKVSQQNSSSSGVTVQTEGPDYKRSDLTNKASNLSLQVVNHHPVKDDIATICSQASRGYLVLAKPSQERRSLLKTVVGQSGVSINQSTADTPHLWLLGPASIQVLRSLQNQLYQQQFYASLMCDHNNTSN